MRLFDIMKQDLSEELSERERKGSDVIQAGKWEHETGLTSAQASRRLEEYGENKLRSDRKVSPLKILLAQFKDVLVIILLISTVISALLGDFTEALAIGVIVVLNGLMGFFQEYRTEKTLEALKRMSAPTAKVYRDQKLVRLPTSELVPGDVIELEAGDKVPADARLLSSTALYADESILTGESVPVEKTETVLGDESLSSVYMGTIITSGRAKARVEKTGMQTKMGGIADMLGQIEDDTTPLQKRLDELGKYIGVGCLVICAVVAVAGILRGENPLDMLITGVSLSVAAVPEGLPAIVTIALALAVKRMVKRRALIRRIYAVETLGCASVICTDKTGTLTQNKMTVKKISTLTADYEVSGDGYGEGELTCQGKRVDLRNHLVLRRLLEASVLCNNSKLLATGEPYGDPTEIALLVAAKKAGVTAENVADQYAKLAENPFDSVKKYMSVSVKQIGGQRWLFVKGAVDVILDRCATASIGNDTCFITRKIREQILNKNEELAGKALRVIGFAVKPLEPHDTVSNDSDLTFLGLAGMIDPPRKEVCSAIRKCNRAGIKTIMITGDHKTTALAIAEQIGIHHKDDLILTGNELEKMSDVQLDEVVCNTTVFARVSPSHKLRIVRSLKRHGHVVAMTGDGVNDAPAIKEADIGVAMGISGSDVTKEASELILLDDNFATLVSTVEEGRTIYSNIRKFIRYLLSCNIGEVLTMFLGILMGLPVVLLPIQILLVNLATDGPPAIALGLEPAEDNVMSQRPRRKSDSIFAHGLLTKIVFRGCLIGLTTLAVFVTIFRQTSSLETARTAAFLTLVLTQLIHVFECKSESKTIFSVPYFNNVPLILAVLLSLAVVLGSIYFVPAQAIFSTVSLGVEQLLVVLSYCAAVPVISAIFKWLTHRGK